MVKIVFESHGTTFDNEAKVSSGHCDVELAPLGEEQAKKLGERHKNRLLDAIFCSDLKRSYRTAEIAFTDRDIPIIKDARLRECDYGEMTRRPSSEVEAHRSEYIEKPFPGGESYTQAAARMKSFLQELRKDYQGTHTIMIIGHRATQYGLAHWLKDVPLPEAVTAPWVWQPGWIYYLKKI